MPSSEELFSKGLAAYGKGNLDEASACFKEALQLDPDYADAYFALANTYNRKGNLEEAITMIKRAIQLNPDEALYHTELSRLCVKLGMVPEAEAAKAEALRLQQKR